MKISFFKNWTIATGIDYSYREDCAHVEEIDFNPETQEPTLIEKKWKYSVKIVDKILDPTTNS